MLCESSVPDIEMPECTFIYGPGIVFLGWTADVDNLTQLACEHVSRFRRACHITFSVALRSIYVCLLGLLTPGIVIYHFNILILTHRGLPWFQDSLFFRTHMTFIFPDSV